jgi:defect in organelle trafficking protein DotB
MSTSFLWPSEPSRFTAAYFNKLLIFANQFEASDVTIQTKETVFAEIQGRLRRITKRPLDHTEVSDFLNHIYGANGVTQLLCGKDIDTHYDVRPGRLEHYRYRVNGTACHVDGFDGIQLTLRSIPITPPKLSDMNLPKAVEDAISPQEGVIYITGSTGSGKSTLLASIIRHLAESLDSNRKILTYEAPIEFTYDAIKKPSSIISQSEIPKHLPSFAAGVRNALRRKPRLILVGEARDVETIAAVMEAAMTGHPVYTTLHSNGVPEVLRRLVNTFPAGERNARMMDVVETLRVIIWQKLVPTIDNKRMALREFLVFDASMRDHLLDSDPITITRSVRKLLMSKGQPMQVEAEKAYRDQRITEATYTDICRFSERALAVDDE